MSWKLRCEWQQRVFTTWMHAKREELSQLVVTHCGQLPDTAAVRRAIVESTRPLRHRQTHWHKSRETLPKSCWLQWHSRPPSSRPTTIVLRRDVKDAILRVQPHHDCCVVNQRLQERLVKTKGLAAEKVEAVIALAEDADGAVVLDAGVVVGRRCC